RRACIEAAGGWTHDTLTEDLDLSYRAQLEGWRFVYDDTTEARAELPVDLEALRSQQRRWVKGSIQTARKILPRLLAGPWPAAVDFAVVAVIAAGAGRWLAVPMPLMFLVAFGWVGASSLRASLRAVRAGRSSSTGARAARSACPRSRGRAPGSPPTGRTCAP